MTKRWVTLPYWSVLREGQIGFLAERFDLNKNDTVYWDVRPDPIRTLGSRQPLLIGGAGAYNNVAWIAHGLGRVVRLNKDGTRAYVENLDAASPEGRAFLQGAGFPNLIPEGAHA